MIGKLFLIIMLLIYVSICGESAFTIVPNERSIILTSIDGLAAGDSAANRTAARDAQTSFCKPGMSSQEIVAIQAELAKQQNLTISLDLTLGEDLIVKCVLIPPGEFVMGSYLSPDAVSEKYGGASGQYELEHPQHPVRLTKPFYIGITEVTQRQWNLIMDENQSPVVGDSLPVYAVSWDQCIEFCEKLSETVKRDCRLPTEAEWEYVCRSATVTPFFFGDNIDKSQANFDNTGPVKVGTYSPNPWGVYDMHGNVREWVADSYGGYADTLQIDPTGPPDHIGKMLRGGGYDVSGQYRCRCAWRYAHLRSAGDQLAGFRIVVDVQSR